MGTGLNLLLSFLAATEAGRSIHYSALELYPLSENEWRKLNYCELLQRPDLLPVFTAIHEGPLEEDYSLGTGCMFRKMKSDLTSYANIDRFDLIYFDAFAPGAQPELWTAEIFRKLFESLLAGGILVTYCSKSDVRRAMQSAGFTVEKLPGPPRKREMLRALKLN